MSKGLKVEAEDGGGFSPPRYYKEPPMAKIDIHDEESLEKWGNILHLERHELLKAIEEYGPVVRDIRRGFLNKSGAA